MSRLSTYTHVFHLPVDRPTVFDLFADPRRLDALTPRWFQLVPRSEVPARLGLGSEISYRLRWRGVPLRWTSRITDWREPESFVYEQVVGPYRSFRHEHFFEEVGGGTEIRDHVLFESHGGALADRWLAKPDLRRVFLHRERRARALLDSRTGVDRPPAALRPPRASEAVLPGPLRPPQPKPAGRRTKSL